MTPTGGDAHGAETSVADMREGAIFSEGRGQSGARGGRRASGGWGAGSVGENAPRPPASPPPARGEAEGRRDGHTDPQQDRGWAIPWGPVTRSYVLTDTHSTVLSTQGHTRHTGHTLQQVVHTWTRAPGGSQVGSLRWCWWCGRGRGGADPGSPGGPGESPVLTGAVGRLPERGGGWKQLSPGSWERPGPRSLGPPCQDPKPRTVRALASLEPPGPWSCSMWGRGGRGGAAVCTQRDPAGAGDGDWGCANSDVGEGPRPHGRGQRQGRQTELRGRAPASKRGRGFKGGRRGQQSVAHAGSGSR